MPLFKLKHGTYSDGSGADRKVYNWRDPERNVVESSENLAALMPEKFERMEEHWLHEDDPSAPRSPQANRKSSQAPSLAPTTAKAVNPSSTDIEDRYEVKLEDATVKELNEIAALEGIEVPKSPPAPKAEVIKAIRAGKHPASTADAPAK